MKKLSLDQLKEKVTVLTDSEAKQSISGGESIPYWIGYYMHAAFDAGVDAYEWVSDQVDEWLED